ncbi:MULTISPECIES: (2Fe-2S)-binding protein [Halomonas]|uniref:Bacterioferritin-associated ferredoxin n=1 Tax=Halomonas shengliensis TaxID=419597 RepID=A0A1H0KC86_9GAMM|nr:(2Fe-2S)-binding protein [Halomonas shengliensis]SDO53381.1 bacterioferritin-associated ferredoxin [Halomonas shengliensis]
MYVCICKGVSDHRIRQAVEEGARSWREVQAETGCGTQCGKCACVGKSLTREAVREELMAAAEDLAYAV